VITGESANQADCNSVSSIVTTANYTITITLKDVNRNQNQGNNIMAVFGVGGGVPGIADSGILTFMGFNSSSHQIKRVGAEEYA
jgi:hypothetical protein